MAAHEKLWENEFKNLASLFLYKLRDKASLVRIEQTEYLLHTPLVQPNVR